MSLLREIQNAAISQSTDVSTMLRMSKILAARLGSEQLAEWVNWELMGYPDDVELPSYRNFGVPSYGIFEDSRTGRQRKMQLSSLHVPEGIRQMYFMSDLRSSFSAYHSVLLSAEANGSTFASEVWEPSLASKIPVSGGRIVAAEKQIPIAGLYALQDALKNKMLGFAMDIELINPDAGEAPLKTSPISQEKVVQIFNTNIYGGLGNLSNAGKSYSQS